MKKKITRKPTHRTKPNNPKKHETVVVLRKIFIFSGGLAVALFAIVLSNKPAFDHAVAGAAITRGLFVQTTINLPRIPNAVSYNIYYTPVSDTTFAHAVRSIPANITAYTISALKKGVSYKYKISAVNSKGAEFWWSNILPVTNVQSM